MAARTKKVSRHGSRMRRSNALAGYAFIFPAIIGFFVFIAYPLVTSLYYSFTDWDGIGEASFVGWENYNYLFNVDPTFWPSLRATAYFAVLSVPTTLILGLALAVLLNRTLPGIRVFRTIFYLPVVLPSIAVLTLWKYIYDPLYGLANQILRFLGLPESLWIYSPDMAMPSIVLVGLWGVGGTMIIFLAGLQSVPQEMFEAAAVDGAGRFRTFMSITMPLMTPIMLLQVILITNFALQSFNQIAVLTKGGPGTDTYLIMYKIYTDAFSNYPQIGLASAEAWVLFVIIVIVTAATLKTSSAWVFEQDKR